MEKQKYLHKISEKVNQKSKKRENLILNKSDIHFQILKQADI